ncbi:chemotaxis protein CheX [Kineococcus sp. NBC_00420]|uniref:chemotaxis protein CheX n=1 Tax=Kineococcus sp. NBC_00420 TaxID=2903564 RepID=UPI002E2125CA
MTETIENVNEESMDYVEDEALEQIVDQMWASYFAHTDYLLPSFDQHDIEGDIFCASVTISGGRPGIVTVSVEKAGAVPLSAALLQEDDELADEDVYDSLGELANIVGGNIKALVPDAGPLGLPVVSTAKPLHGSSGRLAARLDGNWQGHWLTFEVWLAGPGEQSQSQEG